jgi:3-phosphoshikimate 1-carboxyvinyltransferase
MDCLVIAPIAHVNGSVALPGSKSISNRILLLAALAQGMTKIIGLLDSDDVQRMLDALTILDVKWYKNENNGEVVIDGMNGLPQIKEAKLFIGNAGIVFRLLTAVLALSNGEYQLSGVPRMHERPIGDLVDALRQIGADIRYIGNDGYPPLAIYPSEINIQREIIVNGNVSSQFLTALLMALPLTNQDATIKVIGELISKPYVVMTLNVMQSFGVKVEHDDDWTCFRLIKGQQYISPGIVHIEGDASSASYFLAAGAIAGGSVRVDGVGQNSIQGDVEFAKILVSMGASMNMGDDWIETTHKGKLKAIDCDLNHIPDAAMTVAVTALFAEGTTVLRNIGSWRVKETDRLSAMATELRKVGAIVYEGLDYIEITPPISLIPNAIINTYGDHRMAMCFSLVALGGVSVQINDFKCVTKTFPGYFDALASISK